MQKPTSNSMNIYNKSKQTSTNSVLPMEINIIFGIITNRSSTGRREDTDPDIYSDFAKKIIFGFKDLVTQGAPN